MDEQQVDEVEPQEAPAEVATDETDDAEQAAEANSEG